MKRNLLIANIILVAAFSLVILGMRNPTLEQSRGPKQRPRAVVENVLKAPLTICCEQHLDAEICPVFVIAALSETQNFLTLVETHHHALAKLFVPSRASPVYLPSIS